MRPHRIVVPPPLFDEDLGFLERREDLAVQQLVSQLAVERLVVTILPRAARLDEQRLSPKPTQPLTDHLCRKFRAVV